MLGTYHIPGPPSPPCEHFASLNEGRYFLLEQRPHQPPEFHIGLPPSDIPSSSQCYQNLSQIPYPSLLPSNSLQLLLRIPVRSEATKAARTPALERRPTVLHETMIARCLSSNSGGDPCLTIDHIGQKTRKETETNDQNTLSTKTNPEIGT